MPELISLFLLQPVQTTTATRSAKRDDRTCIEKQLSKLPVPIASVRKAPEAVSPRICDQLKIFLILDVLHAASKMPHSGPTGMLYGKPFIRAACPVIKIKRDVFVGFP